ncbi:hypothetical protein Tco_0578614 [Tanacetum coccineum]
MDGVYRVLPPQPLEEEQLFAAVKERKARNTILLMAVPKDLSRLFSWHGMMPKRFWAALKTTIGGESLEKGYDSQNAVVMWTCDIIEDTIDQIDDWIWNRDGYKMAVLLMTAIRLRSST